MRIKIARLSRRQFHSENNKKHPFFFHYKKCYFMMQLTKQEQLAKFQPFMET